MTRLCIINSGTARARVAYMFSTHAGPMREDPRPTMFRTDRLRDLFHMPPERSGTSLPPPPFAAMLCIACS